MKQLQVLLVAGTHGNEINGIWLFDEWKKSSFLINTHGIKTFKVIGNPEAKKAGKRYIHNDLNHKEYITTLIHELVHVKQTQQGLKNDEMRESEAYFWEGLLCKEYMTSLISGTVIDEKV